MGTSSLRLALLFVASLGGCTPSAAMSPRSSGPLTVTAVDGSRTPLRELGAGARVTVVVFWSAECPCVRRYQARVDALIERYPGARVVAVVSNDGEDFRDSLAAARERGVRVPLYRDEDGRVAATLGASSTPTVVVLDREGAVRYRGWLDNERTPGSAGREAWLEDALDKLLAGRGDYAARRPVYGCPITRALGGARPCCTEPK